jgi:Putative quorum-sensing-regulated virulence factor
MPIIEFGKHKGNDIMNVPSDYLYWMEENCKGTSQQMAMDELKRRAGDHTVSTKLPRDVWTTELAKLLDKVPDGLLNQTVNYKNFSITIKVRAENG